MSSNLPQGLICCCKCDKPIENSKDCFSITTSDAKKIYYCDICFEQTSRAVYEYISYYGEYSFMQELITRTVIRLSEEVKQFVLDRCVFVSVGKASTGLILPGRIGVHPIEKKSHNMWVIVLDENIEGEEGCCIIAHEIAHAWLRHDRLGNMPEDCEIHAANLTKQWGFIGRAADPEFCNY